MDRDYRKVAQEWLRENLGLEAGHVVTQHDVDALTALLEDETARNRKALLAIGQCLETAAPMTHSHARPHLQQAIKLWRDWRDAEPPRRTHER